MRKPILSLSDVKKSFGNKEILKSVSFDLYPGEITTILGSNGAGKTTILNCILKLLKPDNGAITLDGKSIYNIKNREYFTRVSVVLESSNNVYRYLTGMQNIEYFTGLYHLNIKDSKVQEDITYYSKLFLLEDALDKKVGDYSRGMQQKLAIIISLLVNPEVLLLDEPTLGLDIQSKWAMIDFLKEVVLKKGISIILTTHQMDVVDKLETKILVLKNGSLTEYENIKALSQFKEAFEILYVNKEGELVKEVIEGNIKDIINQFQDFEIKDLKRVEIDLEKVVMEKL